MQIPSTDFNLLVKEVAKQFDIKPDILEIAYKKQIIHAKEYSKENDVFFLAAFGKFVISEKRRELEIYKKELQARYKNKEITINELRSLYSKKRQFLRFQPKQKINND